MIPGIMSPLIATRPAVTYATSALNVDPWVTLGSPAFALEFDIFVGGGVVIGSADAASPSMLIRPHDGSIVNLFVSGKVGAAGGTGGGGDRGRNDGTPSGFVGGGGGGGAGTNPGAGGVRAVEPDPDADGASDGEAGTATTGGIGGESRWDGVDNDPYLQGDRTNLEARNPAVLIWPADGHSVTVNVWNNGQIFAGGDGGRGGRQNAPLPGGAQDAEDGEDLPTYYDAAPGALIDHPAIGYRSGQVTLNFRSGNSYPLIRGRVIGFSAAP